MGGDLQRFRIAQDASVGGYATALEEIRAGRKRSHWIWYVFPQLAGLGASPAALLYGLHGEEEASAYLRDGVLRSRLLTIATAAAEHLRGPAPPALAQLMGSRIDARKLVSSMTLFGQVAARLRDGEGIADCEAMSRVAKEILSCAAAQGIPACRYTLERLAKAAAS